MRTCPQCGAECSDSDMACRLCSSALVKPDYDADSETNNRWQDSANVKHGMFFDWRVRPYSKNEFIEYQGGFIYRGMKVTLSRARWVATSVVTLAMGIFAVFFLGYAALVIGSWILYILAGLAAVLTIVQANMLVWSLTR